MECTLQTPALGVLREMVQHGAIKTVCGIGKERVLYGLEIKIMLPLCHFVGTKLLNTLYLNFKQIQG